MSDCPCCSGKAYEECCEPLLLGRNPARTAEELMRSRYTAYTLAEIDYLFKTSGPRVRREFDAESSRKWAQSAEWDGFEIVRSDGGGPQDEAGVIEFVARYRVKDSPFEHHEIAEFGKINGEWRFQDGTIVGPPPVRRETPKVGRNDPCSCGSGLKFKKCCGRVAAETPAGDAQTASS
jgi:SEC-C motif-containing protein